MSLAIIALQYHHHIIGEEQRARRWKNKIQKGKDEEKNVATSTTANIPQPFVICKVIVEGWAYGRGWNLEGEKGRHTRAALVRAADMLPANCHARGTIARAGLSLPPSAHRRM